MDVRPTLLAALPIVLVLTGLAAAIALLPSNFDIRNKAAEPTPTVTPITLPQITATPTPTTSLPSTTSSLPVTICSSLYNPVCGLDNFTYDSACEAGLEGIPVAYAGPCQLPDTSQ